MLNKIEAIRQVLNQAVDHRIPFAVTALQDLNDLNSQLIILKSAYDEMIEEMQDEILNEGIANGDIDHG